MTTANVRINQILLRRGNTASASTYTGPAGEVIVDTGLNTLRVQNGVTAGGTRLATYSDLANVSVEAGTYSNTNVVAYLSSQNITSANIGAFQTYANTAISALTANAAIQAAVLDTLTGNAATQSTVLDTLTANAATQATTLTSLLGNAVAQQTSLTDLVANAATQAQAIAAATGTYSNANVKSYLGTFDGNIIPSANVTYSLGDATHQWRDLWVSNNTIYIGNTPIRVDGTTLLVNGAPVSGGSTYGNANVAAYLLGNITTGNIKSGNLAAIGDIVTNVRHWESAGANLYIWFDAASKPDVVAIGAFGNIAGWTVSVSDGNSATVTATNPAGYFSISTDVGLTGSGNLTFTSPGYQGETPAPMTISSGPNTWTFGTDGNLTLPGGGAIDGSDYDVDITAGNDGVSTFGHISFTANGPNGLNSFTYNSLGEINVVTAGANDGLIKWVGNSSGDGNGYTTMVMVPDTTREGTDQYIIIDPTGGEPGHIHIRAGGTQDSSAADLYLGGELTCVRVSDTSGIVTVRTTNIGDPNITMDWSFQPDGNLYFPGIGNNSIGESEPGLVVSSDNSVVLQSNNGGVSNEWTFGTDGNLTVPGNINYANGVSILSGIGGAVNGNIVVGDSQIQFVANSSGDGYGLSTIRLVPYTPGYDSAIIIIDPTYPNHIHMRAGFEQDNAAANLFLGGEASHFNVEEGANPNVSIRSNYYTWTFATDGRLQLPEIGEGSSEIFTGSGGISIKSPQYTELRYSSTDPGNVSPTLNTEGYIWITNDGAHIQNYHGGQFNLEWLFGTDGNLTIPGSINGANVISASTFVSNAFNVVTAGNLSITSQYGLGTTGTILEDNGTLELIAKGGGAVVVGWDSTYGNGLGNIATINFNEVGGEGIVLRTGNRAATEYNWNFDNTGNLTFPTGGSVTFDASAVSTIDGVTNISASGTIGANVIQVLSDLTSFGASPAPRIYGFSSIATTGSAVNEGNISASGNLVTGRNAYVTGNVFAAQYNFANGVNILDTITGVTSISSVVNTSILSDVSGDYQYGTLDYSYAVNGNNGQFAIQYSFPLVYGNVDVNVGNVIASNVTTTNGIFWANGQAYSTGGGSYGNTEVAAYLPSYAGNLAASRAQVTNAVDFMYGGYPYMGWQLSGSDTLKLRTNIASGDYTNDAIIVDRQSLAVNVVATLTTGNIITTSGLFWANGTAYATSGSSYGNIEVAAYLPTYTGNIAAGNVNVTSTVYAANIVTSGTSGNISGVNVISANTFVFAANGVNILSAAGGGTYGNTEVAAYLLTWPNIDSNILDATSANITTLRAPNFNSANAVISGGYISALTNASIITATITTLNSTGGNITTLRATNFGTANAVITGGYINSLANLTATTAVLTNLSTGNAVISGGYISALTNAYITTSAITNFSTANAVITGGYASGLANVTVTGNVTAGNLIGYGSNTSITAGTYTSTFDNVGMVTVPNLTVSGSVDATSITTDSLTINDTGWTNFTPTWYAGTGTNSVGDGLAEGRYRQLGKTVEVWMQITMGSTTTFGTGEYKVSLPVASRMLGSAVLSLVMSDTGTRLYNSLAHNAYTTTLFHTSSNVTLFWDTGVVTNTSPFTWTNGDFFVIAGTYEAS